MTLEGGRSHRHIRAYTACCMSDFDHVPPERFDEMYARIAADPHTLLAYPTVSGRGIRFACAFVSRARIALLTPALAAVLRHLRHLRHLFFKH